MRRVIFFIAIMGYGMVGLATNSGGGDSENGYYWWNDNLRVNIWDTLTGYLAYPEEIPWRVDRAIVSTSYLTTDTRNGIPYKFIDWYELRGYGDTLKAGDGYWLGVIINLLTIKGPIKLTHGGKIPPELSVSNDWQNLVGDAWFFWYGKVYREVNISTDGWANFGYWECGPGISPKGKIPNSAKPNATFAPYWYDFETDQPFYGGTYYWVDPFWWNPTGNPDTTYVHADSGAVLYGWRWYVIDAYSSALDAADTTWPTWNHGLGMPPPGHVYVPIPVFIIEWCDVQKTSNPEEHYTFQVQLINPVLRDSNWANFVGRLGRPGTRKSVAQEEVANMWFYRSKCLIPQQVIFLYHDRYDASTKKRPGSVPAWPDNKISGYDLVGIEDEEGVKGLTSNYLLLEDGYVVKFDYFKRCHNDLRITIINPPFNTVLRYTSFQPVVYVANWGRNKVGNPPFLKSGAPIEISIRDTTENEIYHDSRLACLHGLGIDRWKIPKKADGTADTFRFAKIWTPGEIGTKYTITAKITWGLDNYEGNNIHKKDVLVHCDDTLAWHDKEPDFFDWEWTSWFDDYTIPQDYETYIPWGGSQIGFSWIKGYGAWIVEDFPDNTYDRFEMTLIKDNEPGIFEPGEPNRTGLNSIMYPPLNSKDSYDGDGWFDINDLADDRPNGPPGQTRLAKNIGSIRYTDKLWLGDSLSKGSWQGDADGWVVYWTGKYTSESNHSYIDALCYDIDSKGVSPYWDLIGFGWSREFNNDGTYGIEKGVANANWFLPMYLFAEYSETQPCHPMIETYIHTGTYDATLYEITEPGHCDAGLEPGYYIEDNTSVELRAMVANIGREKLTNTNEHPFWIYGYIYDENGNEVYHNGVGITSLDVGEDITIQLPNWINSGDGAHSYHKDTTYDLLMYVKYEEPDLYGADHCPYNDTIRISFKVLWTYDIACTAIIEPSYYDTISVGDMMPITAVFKNVGINDTSNIPITCRIYNAGEEIPKDSLLAQFDAVIHHLNWRCSPKGAPDSVVYHFGDFKVPPTTIPSSNSGRYMRIEVRIAEEWMDDNPNNDYLTLYIQPRGVVEEPTNLPKVFNLSQALPNPVTSSVIIKYEVPYTSRVYLRVYDISGKLVRTLIDGKTEPGYKNIVWNCLDNNGERVSRGIYFLRMDAPKYKAIKKLVIIY